MSNNPNNSFFYEDDIPKCPVCKALIKYGYKCQICGFDTEKGIKTHTTGKLFVHHLTKIIQKVNEMQDKVDRIKLKVDEFNKENDFKLRE